MPSPRRVADDSSAAPPTLAASPSGYSKRRVVAVVAGFQRRSVAGFEQEKDSEDERG